MRMVILIVMNRIVFFDTDILSSFLHTHHELILIKLYANQMSVARQVYQEIIKVPLLKGKMEYMLLHGYIDVIDMDIDSEEEKLYLEFINGTWNPCLPMIGKGEAASIALSHVRNGILASSNYKDVQPYVIQLGLKHLGTMDIIELAFHQGHLTIEACDLLVGRMIKLKSRLPFETFSAYLSSKI